MTGKKQLTCKEKGILYELGENWILKYIAFPLLGTLAMAALIGIGYTAITVLEMPKVKQALKTQENKIDQKFIKNEEQLKTVKIHIDEQLKNIKECLIQIMEQTDTLDAEMLMKILANHEKQLKDIQIKKEVLPIPYSHAPSSNVQQSTDVNIEDRLNILKKLKDKGLITKDEYEARRKKILDMHSN